MNRRNEPTLIALAPAFMSWPVPAFESVRPEGYLLEFEVWQAGRCGICGEHQDHASRRHAIDHDHDTGLVRGLLCTGCNLQEGWQPNHTYRMWRTGINPCAMFGWHYLFRPMGAAPEPLTVRQAESLMRRAAIAEEVRVRQEAEASRAMDDVTDRMFQNVSRGQETTAAHPDQEASGGLPIPMEVVMSGSNDSARRRAAS